jgi:restriction system protein
MVDAPTYDSFFGAVLEALDDLGGSGSNQEIYEKVAENDSISDEVLDVLHNDGPMTKVEYRLRWTQTYLKKDGAINNTTKGIWTLLPRGREMSNE